MKVFVAKSGWLGDEGRRLDAAAYSEGGLDARDRIVGGPWTAARLREKADVFSEARFARTYVSDPARGVPFLNGSDTLLTDLMSLANLSLAKTPQMSRLRIEQGWTLLSRSGFVERGTIGRAIYVREEMAGMALSDDVIRVAPRLGMVPSGYLFAFLSSRPAQAMIHRKAHGSVVQHIEAADIADLPIPIPDEADQRRIHGLVARASAGRTEASRLLGDASSFFDSLVPLSYSHEHERAIGLVQRNRLVRRLDAFHHVGWAGEVRITDGDLLSDLADVVSIPRVPRIWVPEGTPFLSGIDAFRLRAAPRGYLAPYVADRFGAFVKVGELVVQGSGQRYGLLGRAAYIGAHLHGWAASHDLFRLRSDHPSTIARILTFLRSEVGHRAMLRHSYGTSIPHVNPQGIAALRIPQLPPGLVTGAVRALQLRERANGDEESAIREVEGWLG
jgi:type I restriction enzyme S subunit